MAITIIIATILLNSNIKQLLLHMGVGGKGVQEWKHFVTLNKVFFCGHWQV
jgi:hypothetical protein